MVRNHPDEVEFLFEDPHACEVELHGAGPDGRGESWPMERRADGLWAIRLRLDSGWFDFRYLVDHRFWALDSAVRTIVLSDSGRCFSRIERTRSAA